MIQYSSKAVEDLNLDRQNSSVLGKCCHENNSNTTANSSINANRIGTGNDVNIFDSNLTPKTIDLSTPSRNWNNLDKQNTLGVEAIKQSTRADNYSPVVNIKSRLTAGNISSQTVSENSNVKVLSTTIRNGSNKVPLDPLNLKGKRSHTKHLNARGNYIQINKVDAQTRVSEGIQRSELSLPEVTHLGNRKSNDKQHGNLHTSNTSLNNNSDNEAPSPNRQNIAIPVRITNRGHVTPNRTEPFQTRKKHVRSYAHNNQRSNGGGHWGLIMDRCAVRI